MKHRRVHHFRKGQPCFCPWGDRATREASIKQSTKMDWLRKRPDMQHPEKQELLDKMKDHPDSLLPWMVREHNRGNINSWHPLYHGFQIPDRNLPFGPEVAHKWQDHLKDMSRRRQGLDLMQHSAPELADKMEEYAKEVEERKRGELGQVVHKFDDGWSVRRLQNAEEAKREGEEMGHCVGSYGNDVESGHTNIYSLRDHKNHPHATMEVRPPYGNPEDASEWHIPAHAWDDLPMKKFRGVPLEDIRNYHDHGGYNTIDHPAQEVYPEFMEKAREHGTATPPVQGEVVQTQGKSNQPPTSEYTHMLDQFLAPHDLQSYKPWWDDEYHMEGPENMTELAGYRGDDNHGLENLMARYPVDEWYEGQPEEYRSACGDANEQGLDEPDLIVGKPHYPRIISSLVNSETYPIKPRTHYDPAWGEYLFNHAREAGEVDDLSDALHKSREEHPSPEFIPSSAAQNHPDPQLRQKLMESEQKTHYNDLAQDPYEQMYSHLGPLVSPNWQGPTLPTNTVHPEQQTLFPPNDPTAQQQQPVMARVAASYYRWVYDPQTAKVVISSNDEDQPRYHDDLADELGGSNLVHGYAYRIGGGWRLTDWEHQPVSDPFVIAQVVRALGHEEPGNQGAWELSSDDWDRMHAGLPGGS